MSLEWSPELDVILLQSMSGLRPVGPHKHFSMLNIAARFNKKSSTTKTIVELWQRIGELWNVNVLDDLDEAETEGDEYEDMRYYELRKWALLKEQRDFALFPVEEFDEILDNRAVQNEFDKTRASVTVKSSPKSRTVSPFQASEEPKATARGRNASRGKSASRNQSQASEVAADASSNLMPPPSATSASNRRKSTKGAPSRSSSRDSSPVKNARTSRRRSARHNAVE